MQSPFTDGKAIGISCEYTCGPSWVSPDGPRTYFTPACLSHEIIGAIQLVILEFLIRHAAIFFDNLDFVGVVGHIDRRYIWGQPCQRDFYQQGIRAYERELLSLRQALLARGFTQIHSYSAATSIAQEDFARGSFVPKEAFVFVDHQDRAQFPDVAVMDSGMFACIYLDNFDDEIAFARRLLDYCQAQGWTVCGDYVCEVLTEFNVFDGDKRGMFLRLQVPVKF